MKTFTKRLTEVFAVTILLTACVVSAGQLTARAQIASEPACAGLSCYDGSDCGSKCFCNRPSSTCYSDALDQQ
jgi:hypothetical protein